MCIRDRMLIYTLAGFRTSYRTHQTASAAVVAVAATAIATIMQLTVTLGAILAVASRLPAGSPPLRALQEGLDIPVIALLVIGGLAATIGGASGRMFITRAPGSRWSMRT